MNSLLKQVAKLKTGLVWLFHWIVCTFILLGMLAAYGFIAVNFYGKDIVIDAPEVPVMLLPNAVVSQKEPAKVRP